MIKYFAVFIGKQIYIVEYLYYKSKIRNRLHTEWLKELP